MGDDDSAAMQAVIDNMGEAARQAKVRKYTPKPKPADEAPTDVAPDEAEGGGLTAEDLERLISGAKEW